MSDLDEVSGSQAWFQQLFNLGGRTSNCQTWGIWSKCYSTEKARFRQFFDVPPECSFTAYGNYLTTTGGPLLEQVYEYFKLVNMSAHACGMCSYQVSCSRNCYVPTLESDVRYVRAPEEPLHVYQGGLLASPETAMASRPGSACSNSQTRVSPIQPRRTIRKPASVKSGHPYAAVTSSQIRCP